MTPTVESHKIFHFDEELAKILSEQLGREPTLAEIEFLKKHGIQIFVDEN